MIKAMHYQILILFCLALRVTADCGSLPASPYLGIVYNPYSRANDTQTIQAFFSTDGEAILCANVSMLWNNTTYVMPYNENTSAYTLYFTPEAEGTEYFNITAIWNVSNNATDLFTAYAKMIVKTPFEITIKLWQNPIDVTNLTLDKTKDTPFKDEWGWIYLVNNTMKCEPIIGKRVYNSNLTLGLYTSSHTSNLTGEGCFFHGEYIDGTATIDVWENSTYEIWFIDKNIYFPSEFAFPTVEGQDLNYLIPRNIYYEWGDKLQFFQMGSEGVIWDFSKLRGGEGIDAWTMLSEREINDTTSELNYWVSHQDLNPMGYLWSKILVFAGFLILLGLIAVGVVVGHLSPYHAVGLGVLLTTLLGIFTVSVSI